VSWSVDEAQNARQKVKEQREQAGSQVNRKEQIESLFHIV
jgi:hypothetical protein